MENESQQENTKLITVQEASSVSGLTEDAIRKAINRSRLPSQVVFGRKVIARSDLEIYMQTAKAGRPKKTDATQESYPTADTPENGK